jgi:hypothetical protein
MCGALRQVSPPTSPLGHLQHARQVLVNELPPEHDLRKRVQVDGKGELLPDQPAGRPPVPLKEPPARKRVRGSNDPTRVLERRLLMIMWDEKYHLQEEWNRVHAKMLQNRKKLGMRGQSYRESDSRKKSGRKSSDSSSEQGSEPATKRPTKKRRKSFADWPAAGDENLGDKPNQKKRRQPDSERRDREVCKHPSASGEDREAPQKSDLPLIGSDSSGEEQPTKKKQYLKSLRTQTGWNLPPSPLRTSSQMAGPPDSSLLGNDTLLPPSFPTVAEVLDAIPTSGISILKMTELFWDRVNKDMNRFYILLHDNADIEADKRLIRRRKIQHEDGKLAAPVPECGGADGDECFPKLSTSDETRMAGGDVYSEHGIATKTRAVHPCARLLARRGGLDTIRNRECSKSTRRRRRRYADGVDL